jgi:DNA invertase Pin-like site-specific DNA recombinase
MISNQNVVRAAYYLRVSTETQELDNQRAEILPFIERRGWKLIHTFEDVMTGRKTEKDRPGFAAMLKAAHQRKFDIVVFLGFGPTDQGGYKSDAELSTAA